MADQNADGTGPPSVGGEQTCQHISKCHTVLSVLLHTNTLHMFTKFMIIFKSRYHKSEDERQSASSESSRQRQRNMCERYFQNKIRHSGTSK